MLAALSGLLAGIPPGSPRPGAGVLLFALIFLVVVLGLNTILEIRTGPPEP